MFFSQNEQTVFVHQYVGAEVKADNADIDIKSDYAENGKAEITIIPKKPLRLALRIPEWSREYEISAPYEIKDGYAYIDIFEKTQINLDFKPKARLVKCSNLVRENVGKAALSRGPFVYCIEEVDNGKNLQMLKVNPNGLFVKDGEAIIADGFREKENGALYSDYKAPEE